MSALTIMHLDVVTKSIVPIPGVDAHQAIYVQDPDAHVWEMRWIPGRGLSVRLTGHGSSAEGMSIAPQASNMIMVSPILPTWPEPQASPRKRPRRDV